jgi:hypothetical protein
LPEADGSPATSEPTGPQAKAGEGGNAILSRLELSLPDGRYLLAYRRLEPVPDDA